MFGKQKHQADIELFTIYDCKTKSYREPTFCPNKEVLMREILNMMNDSGQAKNPLFMNAEDFSVFKIGSYDKKTGLIEAHNLEHQFNMHDIKALATPQTGIVST